MVQNVLRNKLNAFGCHECFFTVNVPNVLVNHLPVHFHRLDIIDAEGQYVFIVNGVNDGVGV